MCFDPVNAGAAGGGNYPGFAVALTTVSITAWLLTRMMTVNPPVYPLFDSLPTIGRDQGDDDG
jgi:hypothetical protein